MQMIITEKEYQEMWKEFNGMTFAPAYKLIVTKNEVDGVKEKVFKYEIIKTTDEVYQDYLNPPKPQPTKEELLQKQLLETQAILANLQEKILLNNGGK
jgi:hypothetical protein